MTTPAAVAAVHARSGLAEVRDCCPLRAKAYTPGRGTVAVAYDVDHRQLRLDSDALNEEGRN